MNMNTKKKKMLVPFSIVGMRYCNCWYCSIVSFCCIAPRTTLVKLAELDNTNNDLHISESDVST